MSTEAIVSLIEWLKPIAQNDTDSIESIETVEGDRAPRTIVKYVKYDPIRALWATVVLSALCKDVHGHCQNIELDEEFINSKLFGGILSAIGCKIPAKELRRGILA